VTADGTTVGIAHYIRLPQTGMAELAVAVADQWQGRGLGSLLLHRIAARARAAGIRWLTVECLASNTAIAGLLRPLGPVLITPPAFGAQSCASTWAGKHNCCLMIAPAPQGHPQRRGTAS